jgi:hypothetical protein
LYQKPTSFFGFQDFRKNQWDRFSTGYFNPFHAYMEDGRQITKKTKLNGSSTYKRDACQPAGSQLLISFTPETEHAPRRRWEKETLLDKRKKALNQA